MFYVEENKLTGLHEAILSTDFHFIAANHSMREDKLGNMSS